VSLPSFGQPHCGRGQSYHLDYPTKKNLSSAGGGERASNIFQYSRRQGPVVEKNYKFSSGKKRSCFRGKFKSVPMGEGEDPVISRQKKSRSPEGGQASRRTTGKKEEYPTGVNRKRWRLLIDEL